MDRNTPKRIYIKDIIDDKEIIFYDTQVSSERTMQVSEWIKFSQDLNPYSITITKDIYVDKFGFHYTFIETLEQQGLMDLIHIPERKPLDDEELVDWVSGYLECSKDVGYTDEIVEAMSTITEAKTQKLYRGGWFPTPIPQIGDIIHFSYIKSWSHKKDISMNFARDEQSMIEEFERDKEEFPVLFVLEGTFPSYTPTDYCDKEAFLKYRTESEENTVELDTQVISVDVLEGEEGHSCPIQVIKLVPYNSPTLTAQIQSKVRGF